MFSEHKLRFTVTYHESLLNAKVIMDDFGQGSQAVGGAGGIAIKIKTDMTTHYQTLQDSVIIIFVFAPPKSQNVCEKKIRCECMSKTESMLPDNGHGGGVVFVLVNSHDKHRSIR